MEPKKSYYAIIPANVRYDSRLKPNAKLLYGEITALANEKCFCWATNRYFADLYNVSTTTVSRWISQLSSYGYITVKLSKIVEKEHEIEFYDRKIFINHGVIVNSDQTPLTKKSNPLYKKIKPSIQKDQTPLDKKSNNNITKKNNTDNNTINNTQDTIKKVVDNNNKYIALAELLYSEHKKIDPGYLKGKDLQTIFNRWAKDIRLLIQADERHIDLVKEMIIWCQSPGNFWSGVVLSGQGLRNKFDKMYISFCREDYKKSLPSYRKEYNDDWNKQAGDLNEIAEQKKKILTESYPYDIKVDENIF